MKIPLTEIKAIVDYLYDIEKSHYEATSAQKKSKHIFNDIQIVKTWLDQMSDKNYWTKLFKRIPF